MRIYVGNLAYETTTVDLEDAFGRYGHVKSAEVITDRSSGRSKGFGFVEIDDQAEATAAIAGLNGSTVHDRALNVNEARPRENRPTNQRGSPGRW